MICLDPDTGERSPEPLKTLLALRGSNVGCPILITPNSPYEAPDLSTTFYGGLCAYSQGPECDTSFCRLY